MQQKNISIAVQRLKYEKHSIKIIILDPSLGSAGRDGNDY